MFTSGACLLALLAMASAATLHLEKPVQPSLFRESRIINGQEANPGEFPHQVTLLRNGYHTCGGSVISPGWVLTAAHCVDGQAPASLAVVVDLHDFSNPGNYIWFDIESVTMHESYNVGQGGFPNDVAVLKLITTNTSPDISKNVIQLASDTNNLFVNQTCVISGWGVTENGNGASVLMKSDVRAYSMSECATHWGSNILSQHICVRGDTTDGTGSCNGDSGGPLVCEGLLAGVTSWGRSGCHDSGVVTFPSVYARVSEFYSWIQGACGDCAN